MSRLTPHDPDSSSTAVADPSGADRADAGAPVSERRGDIAFDQDGSSATLGTYVLGWLSRVRGGESGVLPVVGGLLLLGIVFQVQDSTFLSAGNLTNLLTQGAVFVLLGMAEVFVLLLGEIDLSIGFIAGIGAAIACILGTVPYNEPWYVCILAALAATTTLGLIQGTLITRLGLPAFVVTLAGLLGFEGVLIWLINSDQSSSGGTIAITNNVLNDLVNGNMSVAAGWITMAVVVAAFGFMVVRRDRYRRASGVAAPPPAITGLKVIGAAGAGVAVAAVCNTNRGLQSGLRGIPWVVLVVLGVLAGWTFLLNRTRFGRYIYAIGGNREAARRAGVNITRIRTGAFMLTGLTAGAAGVVYASRLGSISTGIDGGTLVLYAVASAVIGGTSLFGGRGKMLHALIGGIVIATIYNGMGLIGLSAAPQYMVTALVLLAAVTIDAVSRRGRPAS